ncbi:hypothetical protein [Litoreibacter roseus]|uniref:Uncharacterized protein n=1 Tax=Litoreibacter roseus TaxID=2601869 RepID=A0A6N6JIX0_9RHOB|nr:hypothetical protein [Litoreibacter roseus]GFE65228.1 hypothetical protein KIN_23020 [Litoreibacter roseus]
MEHNSDNPLRDMPDLFRRWGFWAVLFGAVALVLVFAQLIGPALETQQSVGTQIGQIAGEIKRSAWQTLLGWPKPEPEVVAPPIWFYAAMVAPVLGVIAVVLSLISVMRRENWRYAAYGTSLGAAAITFQFVWMIAILIVGVLLLIAIIENIGDIFSF